jgi:site-specific DNA recombinase
MRAVAYIRVSSVMQVEGHSLDAQERLFYELCKNRGWEAVRIYREEGKSAHVDAINRRPQFRKLLDDSAKHDFDVVVVHTLDRWARYIQVSLEAIRILEQNNVGLVSITENLDWSTPEGRLTAHMLGILAQYYSESLGTHVKKGQSQRAFEGKHIGGIPFGYESCWIEENGERKRRCNPEHPAGIHVHYDEGDAVIELFKRYSTGTTTLAELASWLNEQGLRTRNMHSLTDAAGNLISGPRLFTTASVRGILHNPFYSGKVKHQDKLLPGAHEALISPDLFDIVQSTLKKNSGRSETLQARPEREYLLKGIIRCIYCGMPMWAQTYTNGHRYYREHQESRSIEQCPAHGGSIPCEIADSKMGKLIEAIELKPKWQEEVLAIISLKDEVDRVRKERIAVQERLRRMGKAYIDGLFPDEEYNRQKKLLEMALESLVVPQASAAEEAGNLVMNLPRLWMEANEQERRKLLLTMLDAVYFEAKKTKSIVLIKPKPPFRPIFQVAVKKAGSDIRIINESSRYKVENPPVFVVETGEDRPLRQTRVSWIDELLESLLAPSK